MSGALRHAVTLARTNVIHVFLEDVGAAYDAARGIGLAVVVVIRYMLGRHRWAHKRSIEFHQP